jgi:hypothetical protein
MVRTAQLHVSADAANHTTSDNAAFQHHILSCIWQKLQLFSSICTNPALRNTPQHLAMLLGPCQCA